MLIDVREPTDDVVGCISARVGEFGPEICYAVGQASEYSDWYVSLNDALFTAAGIEPERIHVVAGGRRDAECLVRLFAALYEQTQRESRLDRDSTVTQR